MIESHFQNLRTRLVREIGDASPEDTAEQLLIADLNYSRQQIHSLMQGVRRYLKEGTAKHAASQLSWRVHLLPYIEQEELYSQFHLDEPWDSSANIQLLNRMPALYRCLADDDLDTSTRILAIDSTDSLGTAGQLLSLSEVIDVEGETLAVVIASADFSVPWTSPVDLKIDETSFAGILPRMPAPEFWWGSVEGAALNLPTTCSQGTFFGLVSIGGGETGVFDRLQKERMQQIRNPLPPTTAQTPRRNTAKQ